jgi:hypothetical protein
MRIKRDAAQRHFGAKLRDGAFSSLRDRFALRIDLNRGQNQAGGDGSVPLRLPIDIVRRDLHNEVACHDSRISKHEIALPSS